ncbi:ferrochelatase [Pseudoalteromonas denitrificans]|uniref:Ferrochelatase n=1 Tax=Pseudoalteromonas denitrificans DSM 6059 TaxID=1123010 RepID=A0A1I1TFQ3_9GAMM|nr:ferrochelatase [Pseudoalteromonas denitrificans]SFD55928.1 ferrochelatase [Pseudoalteromonas denitrificans DSM 6059]
MKLSLTKNPSKYGVLLVNLGTPDEPSPKAVKKYLKAFLSDTRVVEIPPFIWYFILNGAVLPLRCKKVAKAYASIWTEQGSPLRVIGEQQVESLKHLINEQHSVGLTIELAMTYGEPSISSKLDFMRQKGIENILILPLYPQYSATTTAAVFDKLNQAFSKVRNLPQVRFIKDYYQNPLYITALSNSIKDFWQQKSKADKLIFSFHGLPKSCIEKGDPYFEHCEYTAKETAKVLKLTDDEWMMTFQSRFGKQEWLQPYTDKTLEKLPSQGIKSVQLICPAFSADCLETLEEISIENRDVFIEAGGQIFDYIPALNNRVDHIQVFEDILIKNLNNW